MIHELVSQWSSPVIVTLALLAAILLGHLLDGLRHVLFDGMMDQALRAWQGSLRVKTSHRPTLTPLQIEARALQSAPADKKLDFEEYVRNTTHLFAEFYGNLALALLILLPLTGLLLAEIPYWIGLLIIPSLIVAAARVYQEIRFGRFLGNKWWGIWPWPVFLILSILPAVLMGPWWPCSGGADSAANLYLVFAAAALPVLTLMYLGPEFDYQKARRLLFDATP
jgi:succinate dehydrogenase hydrophobic anchor subunit